MLDSVFDYNTIFRILFLGLMSFLNPLVNHGLSLFLSAMERPFNLKGGGGGGYVFFLNKYSDFGGGKKNYLIQSFCHIT